MAIKIYSSANYVIVEDGANTFEYAKGHSLYTYSGGVYTIKEITQGEFKVSDRQIDDLFITDESSIPYTKATFVAFLRENTGFKTASGGSGATPVGATLMKTGQTTSYRTGDDGDIEAGRDTDFFTLASNNPFGNTNRFTDELGGQTYTNNIVIDWSTYNGSNVLGYYRTLMPINTWASQIDACLALSIGTFTSGWRLFNMNECMNICNWEPTITGRYNYAPFNISSSIYIQTSTTYQQTSLSMKILLGGGQILADGKPNSYSGIAVRTFTVTGTTLT